MSLTNVCQFSTLVENTEIVDEEHFWKDPRYGAFPLYSTLWVQ